MKAIVSTLFKTGLDSLKPRFGGRKVTALRNSMATSCRPPTAKSPSSIWKARAGGPGAGSLQDPTAGRGRRDRRRTRAADVAVRRRFIRPRSRRISWPPQLAQVDAASARTALIQAQVASMAHRFADARHYLAQAELGGAPTADVDRLRLNIDQACGSNLDRVLDARRKIANEIRSVWRTSSPLGALLADLREFDDADQAYRQALQGYRDVSPFPVAWVCFQLGVLWGELVPEPKPTRAAEWYQRAIDCPADATRRRACIWRKFTHRMDA